MKERSIQDFADKQGLKRRVIHAPGALDSWVKEATKPTERKATETEGFLLHYLTHGLITAVLTHAGQFQKVTSIKIRSFLQ